MTYITIAGGTYNDHCLSAERIDEEADATAAHSSASSPYSL